MTRFALILFLAFPVFAFAQFVVPDLGQVQEVPCPFDSSQTINGIEGLRLYQTTDGTYDGPVDSSRCLSAFFDATFNTAGLSMEQIDPDRPVFLRYEFPEGPVALASYQSYDLNLAFNLASLQLTEGDTCAGELCTGLIVGYTVPNEANDGTLQRIQKRIYTSEAGMLNCLVTERFPDQELNELIFKFTPALIGPDANIRFRNMSLALTPDWVDYEPLLGLEFPAGTFEDTAYVAPLRLVAKVAESAVGYFVPQVAAGYPGPENINYVEAVPVDNLFSPAVMVLQLPLWDSELAMLPFTALRGARVVGADSLRHTLYIDGMGRGCVSGVVDLLGEGSDVHFRFGNDTLEFATARSCIMLKNGSSFQVKPGKKTLYGYGGVGTFGLLRDGWIRLHENSELTIDNRLSLVCHPYDANDQAYVDLPPGSKLVFGENARLRRTAENGVMMLNVYMNGGELDDSALSAAERRLIRRIYPDPDPVQIHPAAAPTAYPNPVANRLQVFWPRWAGEDSIPAEYSWYDVAGHRVATGQVFLQRGQAELSVGQLPSGWYLLELRAAGRKRILKIVVE